MARNKIRKPKHLAKTLCRQYNEQRVAGLYHMGISGRNVPNDGGPWAEPI